MSRKFAALLERVRELESRVSILEDCEFDDESYDESDDEFDSDYEGLVESLEYCDDFNLKLEESDAEPR